MPTYITNTAKLKCTCGDKQSQLGVLPSRTIFLNGQPKANISDHKSMVNIRPFGKCRSLANPTVAAATAAHHGHLTPMPCIPNTPQPWMQGKTDVIEKGSPSLKSDCKLQCMWAGTISIVSDGQTDAGCQAPKKESSQIPDNNDNTPNGEHPILDSIQLTLDLAGFIPAFGAIPDLVNAGIYAARGDMLNAGLSAVAAIPGAGDLAGAAKLVGKGVKGTKKIGKAASATENAVKMASKDSNIVKLAEKQTVNKSNVTPITNAKSYNKQNATHPDLSNSSAVTPHKAEIYKIETTTKKQANGKTITETNIIRQSDTVYDSIEINSPSSGFSNSRNPMQGHNYGSNNGGGGTGYHTPQNSPNSIFDDNGNNNLINAKDHFKSPEELTNEIEKTQKNIEAIEKEKEKITPLIGKKINLLS